MYCPKCGANNREGARFCGSCGEPLEKEGTPLTAETEAGSISPAPQQKKRGRKKRGKWIWLAIACVLAAACVIAVVFIVKDRMVKKQYEDTVASAAKYLEELDYEKAEASYLEAIQIEPKEKEPYLGLIEVYEAQGNLKQAVQTAKQAQEALPQADEEIEAIVEEWDSVSDYSWVVEPKIEADNIDYVRDRDYLTRPVNEGLCQKRVPYAVIEQDGIYGVIDMTGEVLAEVEYRSIEDFGGMGYLMHRVSARYEEMYHRDWEQYMLTYETGEVKPVDGIGSGFGEGCFYYSDGLHNTNEQYGSMYATTTDPENPLPVTENETGSPTDSSIYTKLEHGEGPFAVYADGELKTDFVYEKCGSYSDGVLAAKRDGKWGYLDGEGNTVIPFEYESSWDMFRYYEDGGYTAAEFCYAASENTIPLVKGGEWELRDVQGSLIITAGIFEEIRPVYEGKCWVKKDGKWGVIELADMAGRTGDDDTEAADDTTSSETSQETQTEQTYTEGYVEMTGTLWKWERIYENAMGQIDASMLKLDIPADIHVGIGTEQEEYFQECEDVQVVNVQEEIPEEWYGKRVKVTGNLGSDAGTAYYVDGFVIYEAEITPLE